jgi:hypothetical protein
VLTRASAGNVHGFKNIRISYMMGYCVRICTLGTSLLQIVNQDN